MAGKLQIIISGASQGYSGSSTAAIFDGTLHDFGFVFSGQTRKYAIWTDSALDAGFSDYLTFNSGADFDTKTTNTVNIGAASPAPGGTSGIAVLTRALVLMRLPAGYVVPDSYTFTNVFKRLRANPGKLITASDF